MMTDAQVTDLSRKVDKLFDVLGDVKIQMEVMTANAIAHQAMHDQYAQTREDTCPTMPLVRRLESDVNAIAGKLRHVEIAEEKRSENRRWLGRESLRGMMQQAAASVASVIVAIVLFRAFGLGG